MHRMQLIERRNEEVILRNCEIRASEEDWIIILCISHRHPIARKSEDSWVWNTYTYETTSVNKNFEKDLYLSHKSI